MDKFIKDILEKEKKHIKEIVPLRDSEEYPLYLDLQSKTPKSILPFFKVKAGRNREFIITQEAKVWEIVDKHDYRHKCVIVKGTLSDQDKPIAVALALAYDKRLRRKSRIQRYPFIYREGSGPKPGTMIYKLLEYIINKTKEEGCCTDATKYFMKSIAPHRDWSCCLIEEFSRLKNSHFIKKTSKETKETIILTNGKKREVITSVRNTWFATEKGIEWIENNK